MTRSKTLRVHQPLPHDPDWLRTRRLILKQLKDQVRSRLGPEPTEITTYARRFEKDLRGAWKIATKDELLSSVLRADIIFGGDFHAFSQAQRTHLKILKARHALTQRPLVLGLEAVDSRFQTVLDGYAKGRLTEAQFLRRVRWRQEWGFPWDHYRPLLEFARTTHFRLLALGSGRQEPQGLQERELHAARVITETLESTVSPNAQMVDQMEQFYIIFGELHLARAHLPKLVRARSADPGLRHLIVHLNSERLYFELAQKGLETSVDVVRFSPDLFCVLASPPWVQWQSYLMYLTTDEAEFVATDPSAFEDEGAADPTDQIASFVRLLAADLRVHCKCDNLSVFTAADERLWMKLKATLSSREWAMAREMMTSGRSFFSPSSGIAYLSRPTVNHAAELAGQYIHSYLSGQSRPLWRLPRDFKALIWIEAVSFYFSKLINHKRQAETLPDLKARLASLSPRDQGREALLLALEQRLGEIIWMSRGRQRAVRIRPRRKNSRLEAARILGGMMGERLYLAHRSRKITLKVLLSLLRRDPTAPGFEEFYDDVVRRLGPGTGSVRSKKERL